VKSIFFGWRGAQLQRRLLQSCAVAAIIPLLSACGAFGPKTPPPRCPEVLLLKHANSVTYFKPGPDRSKSADFRYFVAIPKFHPAPQGKSIFPLQAKFRGNQSRLNLIDEVRLEIPMPPRPKIDEYSIYMGIQLTPQQLEYNQSQANRTQRR